MRQLRTPWVVVALLLLPTLAWTPAAEAQETFQVVSVDTLGCNSGDFGMTVERANLDGGAYTVRTVVTVQPFIYMNENALISINGQSSWNIFNNFTYGPVPNPGTYPIPSGQEMRVDFTLERPIGTILYDWTLIVDGCDTGNILYNGPLAGAPAETILAIPALSPTGTIVFALLLALSFTWIRRRRAS
ncbi:MAG: IPTL-CTERM sorting domain-containing protein [Thermoanaerobaculia bacterium]